MNNVSVFQDGTQLLAGGIGVLARGKATVTGTWAHAPVLDGVYRLTWGTNSSHSPSICTSFADREARFFLK